jgi:hypothetical protein
MIRNDESPRANAYVLSSFIFQSDWHESIKSKFKRERRPLQETDENVKAKKAKHGNQIGRPIKKTIEEQAPRRISYLVSCLNLPELSETVSPLCLTDENQ